MLIFKGIAALSDFRKSKLLMPLKAIDKQITNLEAEYIHFVDVDSQLSARDKQILEKLLSYGVSFEAKRSGQLLLVVPRLGTISPWSSKATDIAKNAGLTQVKRIERGIAYYLSGGTAGKQPAVSVCLYDQMTEQVLDSLKAADQLFKQSEPKALDIIDIQSHGRQALEEANQALGMALASDEIDYLVEAYRELKRNPTDAELMTFAQVNSEHCRHKVFNAQWLEAGIPKPKSLFQMIKNTYTQAGDNVLSAYTDNAAVLKGPQAKWFFADPISRKYKHSLEPAHLVIKVETHNHPVAVEPFSGSATAVGGEIRDEAATGRGARSKMGLSGYTVSNLHLPDHPRPWEQAEDHPQRLAKPLDVMLNAPLGGAGFADEFGRPNLAGYFRTYEQTINGQTWGYHKPLAIAGGLGNIRDSLVKKKSLPIGTKLVVLGGPAMLIGLGGGSGASMSNGESSAELDYASVQRGNGEMERRAQEVVNACWALGETNPILSIHDVGAGGWSNALPELVHDSGQGAKIELRDLPSADPGLSPMEIWCNESQERYVLGVSADNISQFQTFCERERCPWAVVGQITAEEELIVTDREFNNLPLNLPMSVLFGKPPKMTRQLTTKPNKLPKFKTNHLELDEAIERVLHLPAVGSKKFLITIGDRTVGGLVVRDQMVGPWQVPVSDLAVSASDFFHGTGEAMAMGERPALALINAPASGRMAVGEALTNIVAASISKLSDVKLSANWMAAVGSGQEDERLYKTVKAIGEEFCPALGLTIPVGKDSLSMRTVWQDKGHNKSVTSPLSLVISAFAPVSNVNQTLTPLLQRQTETTLLLIDLGQGHNRLGGSTLAQVYNQLGDQAPDIEPSLLKKFFDVIQELKKQNLILAYHDRSDGGLLATICEMMFASRCGISLDISELGGNTIEKLFNEELGAVIQVKTSNLESVMKKLKKTLGQIVQAIGKPTILQQLSVVDNGQVIYRNDRVQLEQWWADTSYQIQKLRDNPLAADQEFEAISNGADPGLTPEFSFSLKRQSYKKRPQVAIFRDQGVNGQIEMAAAFDRAGFSCVDVHLNDILNGDMSLNDFVGLAACGGFSYGDVLGAGEGWAKTILFQPKLRDQFSEFFERKDTFSLGVCNGCQALATLKDLIPGAKLWPKFLKNQSEQFEARVVLTRVNPSPSIFFKDMAGSFLPVPVAHGEGRAVFASESAAKQAIKAKLVPLQYVSNNHEPTEIYPANPNGSGQGITALTTPDGRATILMPHPERAFLTRQLSWHPQDWDEISPWLKLFINARQWVG